MSPAGGNAGFADDLNRTHSPPTAPILQKKATSTVTIASTRTWFRHTITRPHTLQREGHSAPEFTRIFDIPALKLFREFGTTPTDIPRSRIRFGFFAATGTHISTLANLADGYMAVRYPGKAPYRYTHHRYADYVWGTER